MNNSIVIRLVLVAVVLGIMGIASIIQTQMANMKYSAIQSLPFDCSEGHFHALFPKPTDELKSYADIDTALDSPGESRPKKSELDQGPAPAYHYWVYENPDGLWVIAYQDHPEMMGHLNDVAKAFDTNLEHSLAKIEKLLRRGATGTGVTKTQEDKNFEDKYPSRTVSGFFNNQAPKIVESTPTRIKVRMYTGRSGNDIEFRARAIVVKDHAYMLGAAGDRAFVYSSATDRFFDSFKPD